MFGASVEACEHVAQGGVECLNQAGFGLGDDVFFCDPVVAVGGIAIRAHDADSIARRELKRQSHIVRFVAIT